MYSPDGVREWIADDPDEECRAELEGLLDAAEAGDATAASELDDRFSGFLQFGTAGLRGAMAAGPFRMNRAVVRKAAAGLVAYLAQTAGPDALVAVGYDARHHSREFAEDTAAIVAAAGMRARIMPRALPTPLLAYAVRRLDADAGVMVTASHNPARDNGYKVYLGGRCADEWGRGVQLIPPADARIAEAIAATPPAGRIALADGYETIGEDLVDAYVRDCVAAVPPGPRDLSIVYTAMHGVGAQIMRRVFRDAGFARVIEVAEQCEPDPGFPTIAFPNPEEAGALDLAVATARRAGADLIIASDPDADRCSAAVPAGGGAWRQLSGDEIGAVLGEAVATRLETPERAAGAPGVPALANSIVSSRLLGRIAARHGLDHRETLTGFKWIARVPRLAYGYEEAIGFCVSPESVRDKDGLSAGLLLASVAAGLKRDGSSLTAELDRLYAEHGVHLTAPVTVRVEDLAIIGRTMEKVRADPPGELAGASVVRIRDLSLPEGDVPPTDGVAWHTQADDRVVIRPSGTEPKVKCYLEVRAPVDSPEGLGAAKAAASQRLDRLKEDVAAALRLED